MKDLFRKIELLRCTTYDLKRRYTVNNETKIFYGHLFKGPFFTFKLKHCYLNLRKQ